MQEKNVRERRDSRQTSVPLLTQLPFHHPIEWSNSRPENWPPPKTSINTPPTHTTPYFKHQKNDRKLTTQPDGCGATETLGSLASNRIGVGGGGGSNRLGLSISPTDMNLSWRRSDYDACSSYWHNIRETWNIWVMGFWCVGIEGIRELGLEVVVG